MTAEQRAAAKHEIGRVEGYSASDAEGGDRDVAQATLNAWTDYCRDKGLL